MLLHDAASAYRRKQKLPPDFTKSLLETPNRWHIIGSYVLQLIVGEFGAASAAKALPR